jgi:hypothetical protein
LSYSSARSTLLWRSDACMLRLEEKMKGIE